MAEAFLGSSYAIALASPRDRYHQRAVELARRVERERIRIVTTRAVQAGFRALLLDEG